MERELKILAPLLRTLWSETQKGNGTLLFCQTDDQANLSGKFLNFLRDLDHQVRPRFYHFSFSSWNPKPYAPFLDVCKEQVSDKTPRELVGYLEDNGVYHYHISTLAEYFVSGTAIRREDILPGELDYESYRMQLSILGIMNQLFSREPVVFLIENAHNLPRSSVRLLKYILQSETKIPFLCVLIAPEVVQDITDSEDYPWNRLLEVADQKRLVLSFRSSDSQDMSDDPIQRTLNEMEDPQFIDGINAYHLLALEDAESIFQSFIDLQLYNRALPLIRYQVWKYLGLICYHRQFYETAMQHFENALAIASQIDSTQLISEAYQLQGTVQVSLGNYTLAMKATRDARDFARKSEDDARLFKAYFLRYLLEEMSNPEHLTQRGKHLDRARKIAEELGLENTVTYLDSTVLAVYRSISSGEFSEHSYPAIKIAKHRDNIQRLSIVYHSLGMAYIEAGEFARVLPFYNKSRKLKQSLPDAYESASAFNGTGFYYFYTGEYRKAYKNFHSALIILQSGSQYAEIAATLYNLGLHGFLSGNYEKGSEFTDYCLNILKITSIEELRFHSRAAVHILLGLNLIKAGNSVRAWQIRMYLEMEHSRRGLKKPEELFLYHYFFALHEMEQGVFVEVEESFRLAEGILGEHKNGMRYLYPRFYLDYGDFYLSNGLRGQAEPHYLTALEYASSMEAMDYVDLINDRLVRGRTARMLKAHSIRDVDVQWAIHGARLHSRLSNLRSRLEDINQLNMLFGIIAEETSSSSLIIKVMDMLYSHFEFYFDVLLFFSRNRNEFQQQYIVEKTPIPKNAMFTALIHELAGGVEAVRFIPSGDLKGFGDLMRNYGGVLTVKINHRSESSAMILCFTRSDQTTIRPEILQIFSLFAQQMGLAMEKIRQQQTIMLQNEELKQKNEMLKHSSSTDYLTSLGNRGALYDKLEHEVSRITRYDTGHKELALLFIDLDNFKFFNDTYGHAAGDAILVQVAKTISSVVRNIDTAYRYGGDEFVVILPETGPKGARELGQRIIREIEGRDSYRQHLEELLHRTITVPDGSRLSCSVGVAASVSSGVSDIDGLLNAADTALYQAKVLGKHQVYLAGAEVE